jgi:hypothetical protein
MGGPTLERRLREARRRSFVGREAELALFREAIAAREPCPSVLWIFAPGGVGKSTLLDAFADAARDAGRDVVALDLRGIAPSPTAVEGELRRLAGGALRDRSRLVLLLDTFEAARAVEPWLRDELLPGLPADAMTVVAGRAPPGPEWRRDQGWRELLRVVSLRNLDRDDARAFLERAGVDAALHAPVVRATHGHPLALALLVDTITQRGGEVAVSGLAGVPDVVSSLVTSFLGGVPSPRHRLAVATAAQARSTTASLLRRVVGEDADDLFAWLRDLSFVETTPHGLVPHDLARDALDAELRWRDPGLHADVHARVRAAVVAELDAARERAGRLAAAADLVFLHRGNPAAPAIWDWDSLGEVYPDGLRDGDREALLAMVEHHEGAASAQLAAHWLDRRPDAFSVFRGREPRPVGFLAQLALHDAVAEDIAADPGAAAAWAHASRDRLRPTDEVLLGRFFVDRDAYQGVSRSLNVVTILTTAEWLGRSHLAWYYLVAADADAFGPMMAYVHFRRVPDADFTVGGRRFAVFGRDWRREGATAWLERMEERELATEPPPAQPPEVEAPVVAIARRDLADAVRRALRDLHRPGVLAANPLVRTRLVRERGGDPAAALRAELEEAIAALAQDARDERLGRALHCTFVRPAPTQEAAAELLGLPFSTYRGHLARGTDRVVERLWERELYGTS